MFLNLFLSSVLKVCLSLTCLLSPPTQAHPSSQSSFVAADAPSGVEPINSLCPVTGDEEADPRFTVLYNGQPIGLCCRKCKTKFMNDPEAFIDQLPVLAAVANSSTPDHAQERPQVDEDHHDADAGDHVHEENHEVHDHSSHAEVNERSRLLSWLGKFHPPATHLPIGLLLGAAFAESLYIVTKRESLRSVVTFCITLGALGALAAATLGWLNAGFALYDEDLVQRTHRWLGTGTALFAALSLLVLLKPSRASSEASSGRKLFRAMLLITALLVSATGFFGGALIYGIDHYQW